MIYLDKSGEGEKEYSIHCMQEDDVALILEAVYLLFNSIPFAKRLQEKDAKFRLNKIRKALEDEVGHKV